MSLFLLGFIAGALVCASFPKFADWLRGCAEAVGLFLQRACNLTFGVYRKVTATDRNIAKTPIRARENYAKPPEGVTESEDSSASLQLQQKQAPIQRSIGPSIQAYATSIARALSSLARFFWQYKFLVLVLAFFFFGFGLLRGCVHLPQFRESREHAIARADQAESELHTKNVEIRRNERIGEAARDVAVARVRIQLDSQRGHDEIAAHTPQVETPLDPGLVASWRNALDRLCLYARPDGSFPDSCGSGDPG